MKVGIVKLQRKSIAYSDAVSADSAGELRAAGGMDDGLEWKDEYVMDWRGSLTGNYTLCMLEVMRRGRTRIGAFRSKPLSAHKKTIEQ